MQLLLGTNNPGKVLEIKTILSDLTLSLTTPEKVAIHEIPEETGTTFEENALLKAHFFHERSGLPTLADDSGIMVEALKGELGVYTRRWGAGENATDEEWISYFFERMKNEENRRASFTSVVAYIDEDGNEHLFEGHCNGEVTTELLSDYPPGLPFQACFKPLQCSTVYQLLSAEEKKRISHRGSAVMQFREFLEGREV